MKIKESIAVYKYNNDDTQLDAASLQIIQCSEREYFTYHGAVSVSKGTRLIDSAAVSEPIR